MSTHCGVFLGTNGLEKKASHEVPVRLHHARCIVKGFVELIKASHKLLAFYEGKCGAEAGGTQRKAG